MSLLAVVAPVHQGISNASMDVMINCMLAQSVGNWSLLVVSDGPSARAASVVGRYAPDRRIQYLETANIARDHGHTPRRYGLFEARAEWILLTGIDNYYVPLMVETIERAVAPTIGLMYFNFVLDMKGELQAGETYDRAVREYHKSPRLDDEVVITPLLNGKVEELAFRPDDDLRQRALDFVIDNNLRAGAGCDEPNCVADALVDAMRAALQDSDQPVAGGRPRALLPYTGHIDTDLHRQGLVDIGAVVVRTDVAQAVDFTWTHHAADFAYIQACLEEMQRRNLVPFKIPQTLYVHN